MALAKLLLGSFWFYGDTYQP